MSLNPGGKRRGTVERGWLPRRRLSAAIALIALSAGALFLINVTDSAATGQALQGVHVTLGSDGTVQEISSKVVFASPSGITTSSTSVDPSTYATALPVRVLTSYEHTSPDGSSQGTNLADLAGKSGTFAINVTVQNTYARPVRISDGPVGYAIVGTPLTIVATADLHGATLSHVVAGNSQDASANGVTTTGVVSSASGGKTLVHYAALLVPPALSASVTFRLVEKTDAFRVPSFTIAAQPGVNTDPAATSLLDAAFGQKSDGMASQLRLLNQIHDATDTLSRVSDNLTEMGQVLDQSTHHLTDAIKTQLESRSSALVNDLSTLASTLQKTSACLQKTVVQAIGTTRQEPTSTECGGQALPAGAQQQLVAVINSLEALIAGPSSNGPGALTLPDHPCGPAGSPKPDVGGHAGLLGQAQVLRAWFDALDAATAHCLEAVMNKVGAGIQQAISSFDTAAAGLTTAAGTLTATLGRQLDAAFPSTELTDLYQDIALLQQAIKGIGVANTTQVETLVKAWTGVQSALQGPVGDIASRSQTHLAALDALLTAPAGGGVSPTQNLLAAVSKICTGSSSTPNPAKNESALLDYYQSVLDACSPPGQEALVTQAQTIVAALRQAKDDLQYVYDAARGLQTGMSSTSGVFHDLKVAVEALPSEDQGTVTGKVKMLLDHLTARTTLAPGAPASADCSRSMTSTQSGSIEKLFADFDALYCSNPTRSSGYIDALAAFSASASGESSTLADERASVATLDKSTSKEVNSFVTEFHGALTAARNNSTDVLDADARALNANLGRLRGGIGEQLDATTRDVVASITSEFAQAVQGGGTPPAGGVLPAQKQLRTLAARLTKTLVGDGSSSVAGLLNTVTTKTETTRRSVDSQNASATRTHALESLGNSESRLIAKALQTMEANPGAFGPPMPSGSRVLPIFTLEMSGS